MVDNNLMYLPMDDEDLCSLLNMPMENFGNLNYIMPAPLPAPRLAPARPIHWDLFPTMQKVESGYDFDMHINPGDSLHHLNWFKSKITGKVFIKMNQVMTATVLYKRPMYNRQNLFLRGMIVFSKTDEIQRPVKRCANHRIVNEHSEVPLAHILRCCNANTKYIGNENAEIFGERLAFLIPLSPFANKDGVASETIKLEILCQNSCRTGINRKASAVVFTLEDEQHEVIGKYIMPFRVCCSPRRDMTHEDASLSIQRESNITSQEKIPIKKVGSKKKSPQPSTSPQQPSTSPQQPSTSSSQPSTSPPQASTMSSKALQPATITFKMPTKKLLRHVLRCANNEIHGLMALQKSPENAEMFQKYARDIKHLLDAHTDD